MGKFFSKDLYLRGAANVCRTITVTPPAVTTTIDNTIRETLTLPVETVTQVLDNTVITTETLPVETVTFNG